MKKQLFFVVLLTVLFGVSAGAQTGGKGFFAELSAAYADTHRHSFAIITPAVGYRFNRNWAGGVKVGFETRDYPFRIYTPFVRLNYLDVSFLRLFTEGQINIAERNVEGGQSGYSEAGLSLGAACSLSKQVHIVGHYLFVGYSGKKEKGGARLGSDWTLDANVGRFQLGVQVVF